MSLDISLTLARQKFRLDLDLSLPLSGLTGIFGPSGCGKTTLLRCLAGLEHAQGKIHLNGQQWQNSEKQAFVPAHKRSIAMVFQDARLLPHLTIEQNILFTMKLRGISPQPERLKEQYHRFGIEALLTAYPNQISGGQKQRVCLARALLAEPQLILMDEPLSALDARAKSELLELLKAFKTVSHTPILYVSHAIDEIAQLSDHLLLMRDGQVYHSGATLEAFSKHASLFGDASQISVFEGLVEAIDEHHQLTQVRLMREQHPQDALVWLSDVHLKAGQRVRVQVYARDVSISLAQNTQQSTLNILPATIDHIADPDGSGRVIVSLNIGDVVLSAQITQKSCSVLNLTVGLKVWAQVKALAVYG